jgi:hypothetical protein
MHQRKGEIGLYSVGFMGERQEVSFFILLSVLVDQMAPRSPLFLSVLLLK